ncbi:MAG: hypothetical protein ACREHD_31230, partial [Pirellulales bacterium]
PGAAEGDNALGGYGLGIADSMLFVREDSLDPGEYLPFLAAHPFVGNYSDLLHSHEGDGVDGIDFVDTTATPDGLDLGTMFTGAGFQPVSGGEFAKNAALNAWLDTSPLPGLATLSGNPVNFGSFTVTDFAKRTLTFKLVELPANVFQSDTFSGTTETIYFHYTDTSPQLTVNIADAITSAFSQFALTNPPPAGVLEPQGLDNMQLVKGKPESPPQDYLTINYTSSTNFSGAPEFGQGGAGPGGFVTGMAYDLQQAPQLGFNDVIDVSSNGGVYTSGVFSSQLNYLPGSAVFTERGWQFTGLTIGPQNLDWNEGGAGDLADIVLASYFDTNTGTYGITAITPYTIPGPSIFSPTTIQAGSPVDIFDAYQTDAAGNRYPTGGYTDHAVLQYANGTPFPVALGIALSPVDFNLWHPTFQQGENAPAETYNGDNSAVFGTTQASYVEPGHGIDDAPDYSRVTTASNSAASGTGLNQSVTWTQSGETSAITKTQSQTAGNASYYFGVDGNSLAYAPGSSLAQYGELNPTPGLADELQKDLLTNPAIANTYNVPGGGYGSLVTNSFSLAGYSAADLPSLYFNYFLNSGVNNDDAEGINSRNSLFNATGWKSSARVFVSADGGKTWDEIATNDPNHTTYDPSRDPMTGSLSSRQYAQIQPPNTSGVRSTSTTNLDSELPEFATAESNVPATTLNGQPVIDPRQQVQQLFDGQSAYINGSDQWRQARIDLSNYAGDKNLMLRFDVSTSGSIGQGSYNSYPYGNFAYQGQIPHNPGDPTLDGNPMPGD